MRRGVFFIIILVLLSALALAQSPKVYHLKLLAVQEVEGEYQGSDADLFLELKEGSGLSGNRALDKIRHTNIYKVR